MIDKAQATMNQGDSYYFQLYPLNLYIVGETSELPAPGTTYRFTILKGQQKFDETKLPIEANFKNVNGQHVMVMPKCPINFFVPNFATGRNAQFIFNLYQTENKTEYFIAEYVIAIEPYVQQYKQERTVRFQHRVKFSEDYELEFEVYLEKSRFALEKVVKDYKLERTLKSPLRQRKQSPPKDQGGPVRRTSPKTQSGFKKTLQKEESEKSYSIKGQRESATELSGSDLPKAQSKLSSLKHSEIFEPKVEETHAPGKTTARTAEGEEQQHSAKRQASEIRVRGEEAGFMRKNKQTSAAPSQSSSKRQLPSLQVKFKPVSKAESEIKMSGSGRLPQNGQNVIIEQKPSHSQREGQSYKERAAMVLFFVVSIVLMYYSMHPTSKV